MAQCWEVSWDEWWPSVRSYPRVVAPGVGTVVGYCSVPVKSKRNIYKASIQQPLLMAPCSVFKNR